MHVLVVTSSNINNITAGTYSSAAEVDDVDGATDAQVVAGLSGDEEAAVSWATGTRQKAAAKIQRRRS